MIVAHPRIIRTVEWDTPDRVLLMVSCFTSHSINDALLLCCHIWPPPFPDIPMPSTLTSPPPQSQEKLVDPPFTETVPANTQPPGSSMGWKSYLLSFRPSLSPLMKLAITSSVLLILFVLTTCFIVAWDAQLLEGQMIADIVGVSSSFHS